MVTIKLLTVKSYIIYYTHAHVLQLTMLTCFSVATLAATLSMSRSFSLSNSSSENLSVQSDRGMEGGRDSREGGRGGWEEEER